MRRIRSYPVRILHRVDLDWYIRDTDKARSSLPVVVFDGDDTLWATEALYDIARRRSAAIVSAAGLDSSVFEKLQRDIDVKNFDRYGLSRSRFPTSSREAYVELAASAGRAASSTVAREVYEASAKVFDEAAPLAPHAEDTLRRLHDRYRLTVLTKGDSIVQRKRVDDSGLVPLLDAVCVVEVKDTPVFSVMLQEVSAEPASSWSVGNSYGSDVHPAVTAGMRAVWIDAHVWAHERSLSERVLVEDDPNVFIAQDLHEVAPILEGAPSVRSLA